MSCIYRFRCAPVCRILTSVLVNRVSAFNINALPDFCRDQSCTVVHSTAKCNGRIRQLVNNNSQLRVIEKATNQAVGSSSRGQLRWPRQRRLCRRPRKGEAAGRIILPGAPQKQKARPCAGLFCSARVIVCSLYRRHGLHIEAFGEDSGFRGKSVNRWMNTCNL